MNRLAIHKEKLKTILLVVLFLSAVLLSYLYWQDVTFSGIKESVNNRLSSGVFVSKENPEINDLVCPESAVFSEGTGITSVLQKDAPNLWMVFIENYKSFSESDSISIEEISEALWLDSMDKKSLQFTFNYNLPVEYMRLTGADDCGERDYINSIRTIGCSESSPSSVFIQDGSQHKYFRIASDYNIGTIIDKAEQLKSKASSQYYPASMLFGTNNNTLIPFISNINLDPVTTPSYSDDPAVSSVKIAESFFGRGLDFVRKITDDNGTIVYMYGMGEKILTIYNDGTYEYQDQSSSYKDDLNLKKALTVASQFISEHGGWNDSTGEKISTVITSMKIREKSKVKIYEFEFDIKYFNYPVIGTDISSIKMEISGGQVTRYSRGMGSFHPENASKDSYDVQKGGRINSHLYDIVSDNYNKIYKLLNIDNQETEVTEMEMFDTVVERIASVTAGYYCNDSYEVHVFKPSWIIDFAEIKVYFDLYSGEYLGYVDER